MDSPSTVSPIPNSGRETDLSLGRTDSVPLYVDLDGTLITGDVAAEALARLLLTTPWRLLPVLTASSRGLAAVKQAIAHASPVDAPGLTYRTSVLEYVRTAHSQGRTTVLATAGDGRVAEAVAGHLGVFSGTLASDGVKNLKGRAKLQAIQEHAGASSAFEYLGNAREDLEICAAADLASLVAPTPSVERGAKAHPHIGVMDSAQTAGGIRMLLRAIRVHQWAKNALLVLPLLLAHHFLVPGALARVIAGAVAFSFTASSIYLINDVLDLDSDRRHPRKRHRPIASGALGAMHALALAAGLLVAGGVLGALVGRDFSLVLWGYAATSIAYSLRLKRIVVVDVFVLAALYTSRVLAGAAAAQVPMSNWFFAFTVFFFLSLALLKRHTELSEKAAQGSATTLHGRGYEGGDLSMVRSAGVAAGYVAVVVFTLYVASPDVAALYIHPARLWPAGTLLLYWITRIWLLEGRGQVNDDPVLFALKDRPSFLVGLLIIACIVAAAYP